MEHTLDKNCWCHPTRERWNVERQCWEQYDPLSDHWFQV